MKLSMDFQGFPQQAFYPFMSHQRLAVKFLKICRKTTENPAGLALCRFRNCHGWKPSKASENLQKNITSCKKILLGYKTRNFLKVMAMGLWLFISEEE